jgi:translocation and assembly module TamB
MRRFWRIVLRILAALIVLALAASFAVFLIFNSSWFREKVRERIITEVEDKTGGKVEVGQFDFDARRLTARVSPFVLHGKEGTGEPPLLRIGSATLGLRILSGLEQKIDLSSLSVEHLRVRIVFYPDGTNNLPDPRHPHPESTWAEDIVKLAIRQWDISDGLFEYDDRKIPLNLSGEGLAANMHYDEAKSWYSGEIRSDRVRLLSDVLSPIEIGVSAVFNIERTRIALPKVSIVDGSSRVELSGTLEDVIHPRGTFKMNATVQARDAVRTFNVPVKPVGSGTFNGTLKVAFVQPFEFSLEGRTTARGLAYAKDRLNIDNADTQWDLRVNQDGLTLTNGTVKALGAELHGNLSFSQWKKLKIEGTVDSLNAQRAAALVSNQALPWDGTLRGTFGLDSSVVAGNMTGMVARADLSILPAGGKNPLDGHVDVHYNQATGLIALGESYLATPSSRLNLSGMLGQTLNVKFHSTNLDDVLPALALVDNAPKEIPLKLAGGSAQADGTVTGSLENPEFRGQVQIQRASVEGHAFDQLDARLDVSKQSIRSDKFALSRGNARVSGNVALQARGGSFDDPAVSGSVALANISIEEAEKEIGRMDPVSGMLGGSARFSGFLREPQGDATFDIQHPAAYGEKADRLRGTVHVAPDLAELTAGQVEDGPARARFSGSYRHPGGKWDSGDVRFQVTGQDLNPDRIEALAKLQPPLGGIFSGTLDGAGRVQNEKFELTSANGSLSVDKFTVDKQPVGNLKLTASTRGEDLQLQVHGSVRDSTVDGQGSWRLSGDQPGSMAVHFTRMDIQSVEHLAMLGTTADQEAKELPFDGFIEGGATVMASLSTPMDFQAEVTLGTVQLRPKPSQTPKTVTPVKVELRNTKPVLLAISSKGATIRSGEFAAEGTTIEATGSVPFDSGGSANLSLRGDLSLTILQLLSADLTATGNATMQATIRGALRDPSVNGRLELKGASLYFGDLPNGVDNANGVVLFDRKRATIEKLTAETGGGTIRLTGLIEFGAAIVYRLQADAKSVRVRWPEDLSTTFDAKLELNGTPAQSTLSGSLTLNRATFDTRGDLGQLLAASTKPLPTTGEANDMLRGAQFDVRINSSPNFEFQTSLTRDVEADVTLRLRGSPLRPVLLGDISVNQGEIELFGTKYTVNRGDIHFLNPVKIAPNLDVEMEAKARGITVNINVSGTMDKLKFNYSSDPPLQQSEIIALLAVGRDPTGAATITSGSPAAGGAGNSGLGLLGEAASEQLSSRLQRFIGSSHVKIDPTLTALDNLPQARLTVEQQVSRDITVTYITNLNRTQEQTIRFQWDFSRKWSVVAVRDANGLFGMDFQYRKRF